MTTDCSPQTSGGLGPPTARASRSSRPGERAVSGDALYQRENFQLNLPGVRGRAGDTRLISSMPPLVGPWIWDGQDLNAGSKMLYNASQVMKYDI